MFRALLRFVLLIIILAAAAAFVVGYRMSNSDSTSGTDPAVGTSGASVDVDEAREAGAKIAGKVAEGANEARRLAAGAALTAKIKSKMALDDTIEAGDINVDTDGSVVTLRGVVGSQAERERAVQLARETDGVSSIINALAIR